MPLIGFYCPQDGAPVHHDFCLRECPDRCHPLPVLAALINDRKPEPGVYHVTEILNPPKAVYLSRHRDYYTAPESNAYTAFGTAYHLLMESGEKRLAEFGVKDTAVVEQSFRAEVLTPHGTATLTGRADRYEPDTKTLWDYKTEKLYSVKKYLAGEWAGVKHLYQLNIYRVFMFPEAERMMLSCFIKDHGFQAQWAGINAIVNVEVPRLDDAFIRELVKAKVDELLLNEKDPSTIRDCQGEELWGGKRCLEYCPVVNDCEQGLAIKGKGSGANGNHKERKTTHRN